MTETLDLAHLDDAGFDALYTSRIEPLFSGAENERLKRVATFRSRLIMGAPIALALGAAAWVGFREIGAGVVVAVFGLVVAYTVAYLPLQALGAQVKVSALNAITSAVGVTYRVDGDSPASMPRFKALDLLPAFDRSRFEDFFHGERQGCAFDLCEAVLEDQRRDKDGNTHHVTVFRGQLVRIAFPKKFLGITVVRRDAGVFNALRGLGELKRVNLGDSEFERAFEVYGTDQVEARYLVHPVFMERLIALEIAYKGRELRCAFKDGDLLVAIESPDRFEIGDLFEPVSDPARARRIVDDIAEVMKLMDAVLTAERAPLVARGG